jgi:lysyl-tRNA synthetase, class II
MKYQETDVVENRENNDSQEFEIRVEKVKKLIEMGIDPWSSSQEVTAHCQDVLTEFTQENQTAEKSYALAGRIMTIRFHGKTAFADLQDGTGRMQLYLKIDIVGQESFAFFKQFIDSGDIIWCKGFAFKTKMGEITLNVQQYKLLTKCLQPLPEKFHGIADREIKYRKRYLDLITSAETRERFVKRTDIIRFLRSYLDSNNYLEVETPMLHPIAGGATARPFITHHNALNNDFYLRIAPELYLKRLVIGGFERVYEINRNFRNEGVSTRHNPEFTMLEFYTAYKDYNFAMDLVEDIFKKAALVVNPVLNLAFGDYTIDFQSPFERISVKDSVVKYAKIAESDLTDSTIDDTLAKHGVKSDAVTKNLSTGQKIYMLFEKSVESKLIQPTFIKDFPIEVSPLARRDPNNPTIAPRFELFIAGMEFANSYNELTNPFEQADRFNEQLKAYTAGDEEAHQFDADYVTALEYGLPPTVGVGIGIDRLVMLLTNTQTIKEVLLFPTLKKLIS